MEFVYVVERQRLFDLAFPHGLVSAVEHPEETARYLERIHAHGFFVERRKAEGDSSLKQIIPYAVIKRGDSVLLLERTRRQGEQRLHGKLSIGIGGHINPVDGTGSDVLREGLEREVREELHLESPPSYRIAGFLNDDSTAVGSVHFGLVAVADLGAAQASIRETDMMEGRFVCLADLSRLHADESARFESWSSLLVERLDEVLGADLSLDSLARSAAR